MSKKRQAEELLSHTTKRAAYNKSTLHDVSKTIQNAISLIHAGDFADDEIIRQAESLNDDLQTLRASIRVSNALALGRQRSITKAIKEALAAIEIDPCLSQGYLVASDLYIEKGHCNLAVKTLEDGLCAVAPSDWPTLYEKREDAIRLSNVKVDFVLKLPHEVNQKIFTIASEYGDDYDCSEKAIKYTTVSKDWRATILKCSEVWEIGVLDDSSRHGLTEIFQTISPLIKDLRIYDLSDSSKLKLLAFAVTGGLKSVELFEEAYIRSAKDMGRSMALISTLSTQLTAIELSVNKIYSNGESTLLTIPLDLILTLCPNLKELSVTVGLCDIQTFAVSQYSNASITSSLEKLCISDLRLAPAVLEWIIPRCPKIQCLCVHNMPVEALTLINQHCPDIKLLGNLSFLYLAPLSTDSSPIDDARKQTGLKRLEWLYQDARDGGMLQALVSLMAKNKDTLAALIFEAMSCTAAFIQSFMNDAAKIRQYDQLTTLRLRLGKTTSPDISVAVSNFLQRCCMLERVALEIDGIVSDDFFVSLLYMHHLRDLSLFKLQSFGGLQHFLRHHASIETKSTLRRLSISGCTGMTDVHLHTIAKITTLQTIHLKADGYPDFSDDAIRNFFPGLART